MRKTYRGFDEAEVRELALHRDGLIAKWIEQHPYKPATDAQKQRLCQLGYRFDSGLNVKEAGDLLRTLLAGDQPAEQQLLVYARQLRVETTTYVGKKRLYDVIFRKLLQPGNEQQLVAWFTFQVYRTLAVNDNRAIISGPEHVVIQRIAQYLLRDGEVMAAIRQYKTGREWVRFGHFIDSKGQVQRGGRMETVAYRRATACFEKAFTEIPLLRPPVCSDAGSASISASLLTSLLPETDRNIHHRTLESLKAS
jgi:hypothetical protein